MRYKHNPRLTTVAKALRKNMTKEGRHLWYDFLKDYPVRFLRQKVIDEYVADFYCSNAKLVIEVDGSQHYAVEKEKADSVRTEIIESWNLLVVRIPNNQVTQNFSGVCEYIDRLVKERLG